MVIDLNPCQRDSPTFDGHTHPPTETDARVRRAWPRRIRGAKSLPNLIPQIDFVRVEKASGYCIQYGTLVNPKEFHGRQRDFVRCRVLPYDLIPKQPEPSTQ